MDVRNQNENLMNIATNDYYGWKKIAALAFYGNKLQLEEYLKENCKNIQSKAEVAKDTQCMTQHTLLDNSFMSEKLTNFTAYQLINHKENSVIGGFANLFISGQTLTKKEYMSLLVKYTGLIAIHEYIRAQLREKGPEDEDVVERIKVFKLILTSLHAEQTNEYLLYRLNKIVIPTGLYSSEFSDLVYALMSLTNKELESCFKEYKDYIALYKDDITLYKDKSVKFNTYMSDILTRGKFGVFHHRPFTEADNNACHSDPDDDPIFKL